MSHQHQQRCQWSSTYIYQYGGQSCRWPATGYHYRYGVLCSWHLLIADEHEDDE